MEVHFTPEVEAKIQQAAAEHSSSADTYVQQLVEQHLDHDSWFRQQVKKGLEQLDRGEFLTHEEVGANGENAAPLECRFDGRIRRRPFAYRCLHPHG